MIYIYLMPVLFYGNAQFFNYFSRLKPDTAQGLVNELRVFYYLYTIINFISFSGIRRKIDKRLTYLKKDIKVVRLTRSFVILSWIILFFRLYIS